MQYTTYANSKTAADDTLTLDKDSCVEYCQNNNTCAAVAHETAKNACSKYNTFVLSDLSPQLNLYTHYVKSCQGNNLCFYNL